MRGNIDLLSCASHVFHLDALILWINKRNWKHPGPIVNMSVHNAFSFASIGLDSHLCLGAGDAPSDTNLDLRDFYPPEPISNFKGIVCLGKEDSWAAVLALPFTAQD
jgi:hypothetical protein